MFKNTNSLSIYIYAAPSFSEKNRTQLTRSKSLVVTSFGRITQSVRDTTNETKTTKKERREHSRENDRANKRRAVRGGEGVAAVFFFNRRSCGEKSSRELKSVLGVCSCMRGALLCFSAHLYDGAVLELSEHPVSEEVVHLPTVRQGTMQQSIPETPRCRQTRRATGGVQMRHLRAGVLLA